MIKYRRLDEPRFTLPDLCLIGASAITVAGSLIAMIFMLGVFMTLI